MNNIGLIIYSVLLFFSFIKLNGTEIYDTLYINRGSFMSVDSVELPMLAYNPSKQFQMENKIIHLEKGQILNLWLINNDSVKHNFHVSSHHYAHTNIDTAKGHQFKLSFNDNGIYTFCDSLFKNSYLGLRSMIVVKERLNKIFYYWNLKEHQIDWTFKLNNGMRVDTSIYKPEFFTINFHSFPNTLDDTNTIIKGFIGDTILLCILNSGEMNHNLHFHGYHAKIVSSSEFPYHKNRKKDSFPINKHETIMLELTPHQTGKYPIHNHNLGATLGNNIYPNGMLTFIDIE